MSKWLATLLLVFSTTVWATTRLVEIPAATELTGSTTTLDIEISLRDASGRLLSFFSDTEDDLIGGKVYITANDADQTVTLTTTDSIAGESYYWVHITGNEIDHTIKDLQIAAGGGTLPWETFISAGAPVDPADIWSSRLLPSDAADDEIAQYDSVSELWEAVALPSGTAADIDQYDIAARIVAGTGAYTGITASNLSEELTPAAGDFVPCWVAGTTLSKCDIGDFAGSAEVNDLSAVVTWANVPDANVTESSITQHETAIEAAIDTLANLTSAQGLTITFSDAGTDSVWGWDDTANAYENLTPAEVVAILQGAYDSIGGRTPW